MTTAVASQVYSDGRRVLRGDRVVMVQSTHPPRDVIGTVIDTKAEFSSNDGWVTGITVEWLEPVAYVMHILPARVRLLARADEPASQAPAPVPPRLVQSSFC